jgi:hypothetical protein
MIHAASINRKKLKKRTSKSRGSALGCAKVKIPGKIIDSTKPIFRFNLEMNALHVSGLAGCNNAIKYNT